MVIDISNVICYNGSTVEIDRLENVMSAYLCDQHTINAIATYAADHGLVQDPALFADLLTCMNVLALSTRYHGSKALPDMITPAKEYCFERIEVSAERVAELAREYDYQACEVDDYDDTLCARLVSRIIVHTDVMLGLLQPGGCGAGIYWTARSVNKKTGPIPVSTTSAETCPSACPLAKGGCYAKSGNVGILWHALTKHGPNAAWKHGTGVARSIDWAGLCERVAGLGEGELWRHNQAGDLPHRSQRITKGKLQALVHANRGRRGFTYTHHVMRGNRWNRALVRWANATGFIINLSANTLAHADELSEMGAGPVVVVLPVIAPRENVTPAGRTVRTCPATYAEGVTCQRCQWCALPDRQWIVGFPAHGSGAKRADEVARG